MVILPVIAVLVVAVILWGVGMYNNLIKQRENTKKHLGKSGDESVRDDEIGRMNLCPERFFTRVSEHRLGGVIPE